MSGIESQVPANERTAVDDVMKDADSLPDIAVFVPNHI